MISSRLIIITRRILIQIVILSNINIIILLNKRGVWKEH
jgi:hypothetical protein